MSASLQDDVGRRRTFAIISHPDAGKTTLTEKLLLLAAPFNLPVKLKLSAIKYKPALTG